MRALILAGALIAAACAEAESTAARNAQPAGDRENGRLLLRQFGCGSCHAIPGVAAAEGNTGPPLDGIARRVYIAGVLPNSPENMARWIQSPQRFKPLTAMPDQQVSEAQARDIVAFLYGRR